MKTENLDTKILKILHAYFQRHPGEPKMMYNELVRSSGAGSADVIQCLNGLREKKWAEFDLAEGAETGVVWLTQVGIRIAGDICRSAEAGPEGMGKADDGIRTEKETAPEKSQSPDKHALKEAIRPVSDKTAGSRDKKKLEDESPSKCGRMVHKFCNRDQQVITFWRFFTKAANDCPTRPQFYFIHGNKGEGHESFITRMIEEHIKKYAQDQWEEEKAAVCSIQVRWPDGGDLEDRKYCLTLGPVVEIEGGFAKPECSLSDLQRVCGGNQFVALCYHIDVSGWKKTDEDLLRWYMGEECWAGFECDEDIPRFLIFFSMEYPPSRFFRLMTAIKKMLGCCHFSKAEIEKLIEDVAAQYPCLPEIKLTPITKGDLEDWFRKHCIEKKDTKMIKSILKRCKNAEAIEKKLEEIIKDRNKKLGDL